MNQGGYGGGGAGGGGGWGPPPGGGGYGPPPGGGYGYGPPPGAPPPPPTPPPGGFQPQNDGVQRLLKTAVIGGVIGGVLGAIPLVSVANCCFCLLTMAGAAVGLSMFLNSNPGEKLTNGEGAISGVISGLTTGLLSATISFVLHLAIGSLGRGMYGSALPKGVPPVVYSLLAGGAAGFLTVPIHAAFGALGGFLAMQLFFKDRIRS